MVRGDKKILMNLGNAVRKQGSRIPKGLYAAGNRLMQDALDEKPTVPIRTGNLRRSGFVEVQDNKVIVGLDAPYAKRQHEHGKPSVDPDSGKGFLSVKLKRNKRRYMDILGEYGKV